MTTVSASGSLRRGAPGRRDQPPHARPRSGRDRRRRSGSADAHAFEVRTAQAPRTTSQLQPAGSLDRRRHDGAAGDRSESAPIGAMARRPRAPVTCGRISSLPAARGRLGFRRRRRRRLGARHSAVRAAKRQRSMWVLAGESAVRARPFRAGASEEHQPTHHLPATQTLRRW